MDERLTELMNQISPEELDLLIGDLPLEEPMDPDVLARIQARGEEGVAGAVRETAHGGCRDCPRGKTGQRRRRRRPWAAALAAAVLAAVLLLGNAVAAQATGQGLLQTVAQWAQEVSRRETLPIEGFGEDGRAEFQTRWLDILSHTLLYCEETEAAEYQVELSSLEFRENSRRGKWQTAPHAYLYLYVDGQTADFAELQEGETVVMEARPGTCLLVVVFTVDARIAGTVSRIVPRAAGPAGQGE